MKRLSGIPSIPAARWILGSVLALTLLLPGAAAANDVVAEVENFGDALVFRPVVEFKELILTVTGPCEFEYRQRVEEGEPVFQLNAETIDGVYTYSLVVIPRVDPGIVKILKQARAANDNSEVRQLCRDGKLPGDPATQSEGFTVSQGKIIFDPGSFEKPLRSADVDYLGEEVASWMEEPAPKGADPAAKDFVINDDLIVDGSACIGFDCVNGEVFSFDTIRLKENNLRIKFDDTSVVPSFPANDWQLTANESANGGASKFSIDDISGNRTPFTVEANARSHSLYVDDGGRIGSRTSTPSVEIHTIDGDTPTLRLQQDGSSGFEPQTWDVAGNETNFFIRDVTNGSTLPLRIRPGAPSNSIFIDVDGDVGLGTSSPSAVLEVAASSADTSPVLLVNRTGSGNTQFDIQSVTSTWRFANLESNGNLFLQRAGSDTVILRTPTSAAVPDVTQTMTIKGEVEAEAYNMISSRRYKTDFTPLNNQTTLDKVMALPISQWRFEWDSPGTRRIGPMAEDFESAFAVGDPGHLSLGDASGVALSAIQGLHERLFEALEQRDALIERLEARITELENR